MYYHVLSMLCGCMRVFNCVFLLQFIAHAIVDIFKNFVGCAYENVIRELARLNILYHFALLLLSYKGVIMCRNCLLLAANAA